MKKILPQILEIDGKKIGKNQKTYFIAEAGLNHNGDMKIAKKLIDEAVNCGASAVKFQTFKTEEFIRKSNKYFDLFKQKLHIVNWILGTIL